MAEGSTPPYSLSAFINCPFDQAYKHLFDAVVFAVFACGCIPRSALEIDDGGRERFDKIAQIIAECGFGIHDISRTEGDKTTGLPRFNMPLELGLFLGAARFGAPRQTEKKCLILDTERFRYREFISDLGSRDIKAHGNNPVKAIAAVLDFLATARPCKPPGGRALVNRYTAFQADLPTVLRARQLDPDEVTFAEYSLIVHDWLTGSSAQTIVS